ncbi:MAG: YgfZ/GcvT domain-containing protein [Methylococcaceae bacterium]
MHDDWSALLEPSEDMTTLPVSTDGQGFCTLSDYGMLRVSGDDAARFLQGQATCDIAALVPGVVGCGAFCTPKGRVIANFWIVFTGHAYHLLLAAGLTEALVQRLRMYVLRSKVRIENLTSQRVFVGVTGKGATELLSSGGLTPAGESANQNENPVCFTLPGNGEDEYCLCAFDTAQSKPWPGALSGMTRLHVSAWHLAMIAAGQALIVPENSEAFLPQMLNLDLLGGIGFSKGCYTGQEIVTRTHFLGQLKRRLFRMRGSGDNLPTPAAPVYLNTGEERVTAGSIVNACQDPMGGFQCLAVLSLEWATSERLHLGAEDGPHLTTLTLPYPLQPPT